MDYWHSRSSSPWGVHPKPLSCAVHFLGIVSIIFVLVWTIYFRGEAILVYKTVPASKPTRKLIHLAVHLVAFFLAVVGICAAFKYHNLNSIDNLYSLHSWLGIITISLFGLQWVVGFISFFYPGLASSARASLLPWHVFSGLFIYGLGITTTELGFLEKLTFLQSSSTIGRFSSEAMLVNVLGLIVAFLGFFVFATAVIPDTAARDDGYSPIE